MRAVSLVMAGVLVLALSLAAVARDSSGPRLERFQGTLSKVEEGSITVVTKADDGTDKTMTFKVDDKTKVAVPTGKTIDFTGRDGVKRTRPETVDGKIADLKVGQSVSVGYAKDTTLAVRITVIAAKTEPAKPKEGGDAPK